MRGCIVGGRWRVGSLYAVGAEGAVFVVSDIRDPSAGPKVGKIALLPYHLPAELSSADLRRHRDALRTEARDLARSSSPYMPQSHGLHELVNPLLDVRRGGAFAEPEPILLMERLAGFDVDLWLARVHRSGIPRAILRPHLDRVAVVLLRALHDLQERGYFYADLRPGNLRVLGRPARRVRLLDAGSLVEVGDASGKFPHVPHYLPPDLFRAYHVENRKIVPTAAAQAVMAGRTLFEAATGIVPVPGEQVNGKALADSGVSSPVVDVIDGLVSGSFPSVVSALKYLSRRAAQRVPTAPVVAARPKVVAAKPAPVMAAVARPAPVRSVPEKAPPVPAVPVQPIPVHAAPVHAAPVQPAPMQPVPLEFEPEKAAPVRALPARPAAAAPAPARPAAVRPAAATPAAARPATPVPVAARAALSKTAPAKAVSAVPIRVVRRQSLFGRLLDALLPSRRASRTAPRKVVARRPLAGSPRL